jgi:hypothetical protein
MEWKDLLKIRTNQEPDKKFFLGGGGDGPEATRHLATRFCPVCFSFLSFWPPKTAVDCQTLSFPVSFYKIRLGKNHLKST